MSNGYTLSEKELLEESEFILGLDIGNYSSSISFYDWKIKKPVLIDVSGGYGKSSLPSAVQYLFDSEEWVFGDCAILNSGYFKDIVVTDFINILGRNRFMEIGAEKMPFSAILGKYLWELTGYSKNISPSARIKGIVCSVPDNLSMEAMAELKTAFSCAGFEKQFLSFISHSEAAISYHASENSINNGYVLLLDFGYESIRGGIFNVLDDCRIQKLLSIDHNKYGLRKSEQDIHRLISQLYLEERDIIQKGIPPSIFSEDEKNQLNAFIYQNSELLRDITRKSTLYFNFAFPPFKKDITPELKAGMVENYTQNLSRVIGGLKDRFNKKINKKDTTPINTVICLGGGFEYKWAVQHVKDEFKDAKVFIYPKSISALSKGAVLWSANLLGLNSGIVRKDESDSILKNDYGVYAREGTNTIFVPFIFKGESWQKNNGSKVLTLLEENEHTPSISFYRKNENGDIIRLFEVVLEELEKRPKGTIRLNISMYFIAYGELKVEISDFGFGELYPKTVYSMEKTFMLDGIC